MNDIHLRMMYIILIIKIIINIRIKIENDVDFGQFSFTKVTIF